MQTIDPVLQKTVWDRVLGRTAPEPKDAPAPDFLLPLLVHERDSFEAYRKLARRFRDRDAILLGRMAREASEHFQALHALWYAEARRRVRLPPLGPACLLPLPDILLTVRDRAWQTASAYEQAAGDRPSYAPTLLLLAEDERRHCRWLHALLGRLL